MQSRPVSPTAAAWTSFDSHDLARARAGDPEALGRFFDYYADQLFLVVQRFVGSREEAQDLTQEIFLKVRRHLHRLDTTRDPAPWLFTVALNTCRDHARSAGVRARRRTLSLDAESATVQVPDPGADPQRAYAEAEDRRRVHAAVLRLPHDQFMSVVLHDFEGLSHERIATLAGIDHAAARKRHSRALTALEKALGEETE